MARKDKKQERKLCYIEANSVEDICRCACKFDYSSDALLLSRKGDKFRLVALGEKIDNVTFAYYATIPKQGKVMMYAPASAGTKEKAEFVSSTDQPNKYYLNVIALSLDDLATTKKINKKMVEIVKVESAEELIRSAIMSSSKEEALAKVYLFSKGKSTMIGAFDIIDALRDGKPLFYCAPCKERGVMTFARYDYREAKLEFTDTVGEHSYLYARVINLKEPFPFL